ncbi:MAG: hypothetical protein AAFQ80_18635 [Cyanobacteria bacterium J06621_8]
MSEAIGKRLEKYTLKRKQEVLMVYLTTAEGEEDTVMIFGGFSSSLMRPTAFDPEVPVITEDATINTIDRLASPYDPQNPRYIESGIDLATMESLLGELSI